MSVTIVAPATGSVVAQTVTITAAVAGSAPISGVQFAVDGVNVGGFEGSRPIFPLTGYRMQQRTASIH